MTPLSAPSVALAFLTVRPVIHLATSGSAVPLEYVATRSTTSPFRFSISVDCRVRTDHSPQNLSALRKFALTLLRQNQQYRKRNARSRRKTADRN